MGRINLLDKNVSELIAAGEVIERPASIVKELVENSIDAGSSAITIEIKRGGISYIRITDNGFGIAKEDIAIAFKRHATSKIKGADDLDNIASLGFRGEALASIAAVSRIELTSKTSNDQYGHKITLEAGEELELEEAGCPTGTTIIVKDLFYNVPARLKFLKKDISEGNVISGMVDKLALSHPEVSFKFISDNKIKLHTPGNGELLSAIHALFGKEVSSSMIPVDYEYNGVKVDGYTSHVNACRASRSMQTFFVNSRYVRSKICFAAIEEGYKNSIMVGKHPSCIINVNVPFDTVDVNVHPAKIEVRFINEKAVFDIIYFAIKSAISKHDELSNVINTTMKTQQLGSVNILSTFKNEDADQMAINNKSSTDGSVNYMEIPFKAVESILLNDRKPEYKTSIPTFADTNINNFETASEFNYITSDNLLKNNKDNFNTDSSKPRIKLEEPIKQEKTFEAEVKNLEQVEVLDSQIDSAVIQEDKTQDNDFQSLKIIGELFKTYILFEAENTFIMLDKHAAHERIIYEKLKKSVSTDEKQLLLKPIIVVLSTDEFTAIISNIELLSKMGFTYDEFGNNTIAVREVPMILSQFDITSIIIDVAQKLSLNRRDATSDIFQNLLHSIACRSAIKANDFTSVQEMEEIIRLVIANDEIRHCPHGRPIVTILSKFDIEKRFGRI